MTFAQLSESLPSKNWMDTKIEFCLFLSDCIAKIQGNKAWVLSVSSGVLVRSSAIAIRVAVAVMAHCLRR